MSKQIARRTTDRVIEQYGENIADRPGCVTATITDAQVTALLALLAQPNGGITANADGTFTALPYVAPPPLADQTAFDAAVAKLKATYGTARSVADVNASLDALTVVMRRLYRELQ